MGRLISLAMDFLRGFLEWTFRENRLGGALARVLHSCALSYLKRSSLWRNTYILNDLKPFRKEEMSLKRQTLETRTFDPRQLRVKRLASKVKCPMLCRERGVAYSAFSIRSAANPVSKLWNMSELLFKNELSKMQQLEIDWGHTNSEENDNSCWAKWQPKQMNFESNEVNAWWFWQVDFIATAWSMRWNSMAAFEQKINGAFSLLVARWKSCRMKWDFPWNFLRFVETDFSYCGEAGGCPISIVELTKGLRHESFLSTSGSCWVSLIVRMLVAGTPSMGTTTSFTPSISVPTFGGSTTGEGFATTQAATAKQTKTFKDKWSPSDKECTPLIDILLTIALTIFRKFHVWGRIRFKIK